MHAAPTDLLSDVYSEDEYLADLLRVTSSDTDETLARLVIRESATCTEWMRSFGVRF